MSVPGQLHLEFPVRYTEVTRGSGRYRFEVDLEQAHINVDQGKVTIKGDPKALQAYGVGRTIGEHELEGHQPMQRALASPDNIRALLAGELSAESPYTGDVVTPLGVQLPDPLERTFATKDEAMAYATKLRKSYTTAVFDYLSNNISYIDQLANHGPGLVGMGATPARTPYRIEYPDNSVIRTVVLKSQPTDFVMPSMWQQ